MGTVASRIVAKASKVTASAANGTNSSAKHARKEQKKPIAGQPSHGGSPTANGATSAIPVLSPTKNAPTMTGHESLDGIETIPATLRLTYLAEGAANIIYRLSLSPQSLPSDKKYTNKLLRLRKALPSSSPNLPAFESLRTRFHPLLPPQSTVGTELVRLPPGLIDRENAAIIALEANGARKESRRGLYLAIDEPYAFLLEDMTPHASENGTGPDVLVEFKPKWLVQSPAAPAGSKRCRTCAHRLKKLAVAKKKGKTIPVDILKAAYCPFDLESGDIDRVRLAVRKMLAGKGAVKLPKGMTHLEEEQKELLTERTVQCLMEHTLLKELAKLQTELDKNGIVKTLNGYIDGSGAEEDLKGDVGKLATCMTLRDLTLFLRVNLATNPTESPVLLRIGDLDLKSPANGKADYWVKTEQGLIDEGYYTGTEDRSLLPEFLKKEEIEHWCAL